MDHSPRHYYAALLAVLLSTCILVAEQDNNRYVHVTGINGSGKTEEAAVKTALLNAVRYVSGEYIQAREELINKKTNLEILSLANGSITSFEVVERRSAESLFYVTIDCVVERSAPSLFTGIDPSVSKVDYRSLWAGISTKLENKRDALKILEDTVPRLAPRILKVKLISDPRYDQIEALPNPEVQVNLKSEKSTLRYFAILEIDCDFWATSVAPVFSKCFSSLADDVTISTEHFDKEKLSDSPENSTTVSTHQDEGGLGFAPSPHASRIRDKKHTRNPLFNNKNSGIFRLDFAAESGVKNSRFEMYSLEEQEALAVHSIFSNIADIRIKISLINSSGNILANAYLITPPPYFSETTFNKSNSRGEVGNMASPSGFYLGPRLRIGQNEYDEKYGFKNPVLIVGGELVKVATLTGAGPGFSLLRESQKPRRRSFSDKYLKAGFIDAKIYMIEFDVSNSEIKDIAGYTIQSLAAARPKKSR